MRSTIVRTIGSLGVLLLALGLSACGGDSGGDSAGGADPERYCELVAELETDGSAAFDEIEADENATEEDFAAASKAFTEASEEKFNELIEVSPTEIKEDVEVLIASIRAQSGQGDEVDQEEATAAEADITAWEEENC
jgi:hypothetical protein